MDISDKSYYRKELLKFLMRELDASSTTQINTLYKVLSEWENEIKIKARELNDSSIFKEKEFLIDKIISSLISSEQKKSRDYYFDKLSHDKRFQFLFSNIIIFIGEEFQKELEAEGFILKSKLKNLKLNFKKSKQNQEKELEELILISQEQKEIIRQLEIDEENLLEQREILRIKGEILYKSMKGGSNHDKLLIEVNSGDATPEEIAEILSDISILYRRMGGSGLNLSVEGVKEKKEVTSW